MRPYYIYQCDPIVGSRHFRTPVSKGLEIIAGLRGHTTGYAVPAFVVDAPGGGGKIQLLPDAVVGRDGDDLLLPQLRGQRLPVPGPARRGLRPPADAAALGRRRAEGPERSARASPASLGLRAARAAREHLLPGHRRDGDGGRQGADCGLGRGPRRTRSVLGGPMAARALQVDDGSDPTWALAFHMDGSRPILRHRPNRDCVFLGARGLHPARRRPGRSCAVCTLRDYDETGPEGPRQRVSDRGVVPEGMSITDSIGLDPERAERWRAPAVPRESARHPAR